MTYCPPSIQAWHLYYTESLKLCVFHYWALEGWQHEKFGAELNKAREERQLRLWAGQMRSGRQGKRFVLGLETGHVQPSKRAATILDCSVCTCLAQLYDGRDMYRIYYIKNYMFRYFTLAIFRLRNKKILSKQPYSTYVGCIQWGGKRWSGCEISHVLCRVGGVGTWVLLLYAILG